MMWYAIYTKPSQEKRAAENLEAWGLETLAPWLSPSGASPFSKPLFPRYIFGRFDAAQMLHKVYFTRGVSSVVSFGGQPAIIMDDVITAIRERVDRNGKVVREPTGWKTGDTVVIESGPLRSLKGIFERDLPDGERVRILLEMVTYSAHIEIARSALTKLAVSGWHSAPLKPQQA